METRQERLAQFAQEMAQEQRDPADFLEAWRDAVKMAGENWFMLRKPLHECTCLDDMQPKWDFMRSRIGVLSGGEQVFIKAISQFYNADIFPAHDRPTLVEISNSLDLPRLRIVMKLMRYYTGW